MSIQIGVPVYYGKDQVNKECVEQVVARVLNLQILKQCLTQPAQAGAFYKREYGYSHVKLECDGYFKGSIPSSSFEINIKIECQRILPDGSEMEMGNNVASYFNALKTGSFREVIKCSIENMHLVEFGDSYPNEENDVERSLKAPLWRLVYSMVQRIKSPAGGECLDFVVKHAEATC